MLHTHTYAHATKCSSSRNVTIKDVHQRCVAITFHHHLLVPQLFCNILGTGATYLHVYEGRRRRMGQNVRSGEITSNIKSKMKRLLCRVDDYFYTSIQVLENSAQLVSIKMM